MVEPEFLDSTITLFRQTGKHKNNSLAFKSLYAQGFKFCVSDSDEF
jgi:hypothetical protein